MEIDFEEIARLQHQVFELKMSLGVLCALITVE